MITNRDIIAELRRIADENGGVLRPDSVVEAARPASSVLHSQFDWSDSIAGRKWRLHQARQLIRVTVEYIGPEGSTVLSHVFVSLTSDRVGENTGYRTTVAVMSNAEQRARLFEDAVVEMRRFQSKYSSLQELAEVFDAMRAVTKRPRRRAAAR